MKIGRIVCWLVLLLPVIGGFFWGLSGDPLTMKLPRMLLAPSLILPFGTDHLGRDILARAAHGFLWDLALGLSVVGLSAFIGIVLGMIAGYCGRLIDALIILLMDILMSLPHIVLAMVIMMYLSYGSEALVLSLVLSGWVKYARIARAQTCSLKKQDFIICEKVLGADTLFILSRHILPNILPAVVGLAALHLGHTLLSIAALGFLGLGLQPPTPEWGTMIMESRPYIMRAPWMAIFPGLCIFLFICVFTLIGRYFDRRFNATGESNADY
jgi:ABC-type dipeptide/oligopeptide/nickel transport system permease subunit